MTRSNLHITLSSGYRLQCVADSSSAPEQGYIVEQLFLPLLLLDDHLAEIDLITEHCTMGEQRVNAAYRYEIDLQSKSVRFYEEHYRGSRFERGKDISSRLQAYISGIPALRSAFAPIINLQQ